MNNPKIPIPYQGDEPYIFLSYSRKNRDEALEIIKILQMQGCRVWYDEGILPGKEWEDYIASKVENCFYFFSLVTDDYLESQNCLDELFLSREEQKNQLFIYEKNVNLPRNLKLRYGRIQAIEKFKYTDTSEFIHKILSTDGIEICIEENFSPQNLFTHSSISLKEVIFSPLTGEIVCLSDIHDPVFASGAMGKGVGIRPSNEIITSPVDGVVLKVIGKGNMYFIKSISGVDILIHIGLDTVSMDGKGFIPTVKENQQVRRGEVLGIFSLSAIKSSGLDCTSVIIVTNFESHKTILPIASSIVRSGDEIIRVY